MNYCLSFVFFLSKTIVSVINVSLRPLLVVNLPRKHTKLSIKALYKIQDIYETFLKELMLVENYPNKCCSQICKEVSLQQSYKS